MPTRDTSRQVSSEVSLSTGHDPKYVYSPGGRSRFWSSCALMGQPEGIAVTRAASRQLLTLSADRRTSCYLLVHSTGHRVRRSLMQHSLSQLINSQFGAHHLACAIAHWECDRRLVHRNAPRPHLSHCHESLCQDLATLALDWQYWVDCGLRASRVCILAVLDWSHCVKGGYLGLAAAVRLSIASSRYVADSERSMVAMMAFMLVIWFLVPSTARRID